LRLLDQSKENAKRQSSPVACLTGDNHTLWIRIKGCRMEGGLFCIAERFSTAEVACRINETSLQKVARLRAATLRIVFT
jgi:hypothetical protein